MLLILVYLLFLMCEFCIIFSTIRAIKGNTSSFIAHRSSNNQTVKEVLTELSKRKIRPIYGMITYI